MFRSQPILILEDEPWIAFDLAEAVNQLDGIVVGPIATVREAMDLLDRQVISAAILDACLLDGDVTPVALRLAESGIPLVVHTGTGLPAAVADLWPDIPVLMKPAPAQTVAQRLADEIQKCRRSDG